MKPFGETLVGGVYAAVPSAQNSRAKGEDLMRREGDPAQIDAPCHVGSVSFSACGMEALR